MIFYFNFDGTRLSNLSRKKYKDCLSRIANVNPVVLNLDISIVYYVSIPNDYEYFTNKKGILFHDSHPHRNRSKVFLLEYYTHTWIII